tara:strand:- start:52 stop:378 length:327 start_codon:yes stop_codon:yes gene_type:complete
MTLTKDVLIKILAETKIDTNYNDKTDETMLQLDFPSWIFKKYSREESKAICTYISELVSESITEKYNISPIRPLKMEIKAQEEVPQVQAEGGGGTSIEPKNNGDKAII